MVLTLRSSVFNCQLHSWLALPSQVASDIVNSHESHVDQAASLYQSLLGRAGDTAGLTYWADQMDSGTSSSTCNGQLTGHAGCNISVVFAPTALGPQTGTLTVYDALRTQTVPLTGTGIQNAVLSVSPTSLSFAVQDVGVASAPSPLTISNAGGLAAANVALAEKK